MILTIEDDFSFYKTMKPFLFYQKANNGINFAGKKRHVQKVSIL